MKKLLLLLTLVATIVACQKEDQLPNDQLLLNTEVDALAKELDVSYESIDFLNNEIDFINRIESGDIEVYETPTSTTTSKNGGCQDLWTNFNQQRILKWRIADACTYVVLSGNSYEATATDWVAVYTDGVQVSVSNINNVDIATGILFGLFNGRDIDGDGYANDEDVFPNDRNEWIDSDNDGVGDNADVFPNNPDRTSYVDWIFTPNMEGVLVGTTQEAHLGWEISIIEPSSPEGSYISHILTIVSPEGVVEEFSLGGNYWEIFFSWTFYADEYLTDGTEIPHQI